MRVIKTEEIVVLHFLLGKDFLVLNLGQGVTFIQVRQYNLYNISCNHRLIVLAIIKTN